MKKRGADEKEVKEVIKTGIAFLAKKGRLGKYKIYDFKRQWERKWYEQKRIEVIYVEEAGKIITVTIYVFYGKWN